MEMQGASQLSRCNNCFTNLICMEVRKNWGKLVPGLENDRVAADSLSMMQELDWGCWGQLAAQLLQCGPL